MKTPQVRSIASRDNPLLVRLRKLGRDPVAYRKLGELWIEGDHLCRAFLQRGGVPLQAVISEEGWDSPLRDLALQAPVVSVLPAGLLSSVSALESPTPMGFVVPWVRVTDVHPDAASIVLDRLQDAGNVGTILRSASAFGFTQVLALKGTAGLCSPKVLRAGMGAHFGLSLVSSGHWPRPCWRPVRTRRRPSMKLRCPGHASGFWVAKAKAFLRLCRASAA